MSPLTCQTGTLYSYALSRFETMCSCYECVSRALRGEDEGCADFAATLYLQDALENLGFREDWFH